VLLENGPPIGTLVEVEITGAGPNSLTGVPALSAAA
jgi:hypothetical protein